MFKRILLPTDFSPSAHEALRIAREHFPNATFKFLHVISNSEKKSEKGGDLESYGEKAAHQMLTQLARLGDEVEVVIGKPAQKTLEHAEAWRADLIVMGTHGRTGLSHLINGSVAEDVMRHSKHPVLIIRDAELND